MPTGKNKVPMADLRTVLTDAGFQGVKTYIQSGNVVLQSDLSREQLEDRVGENIKEKIGPELAIVVRTAEELQQVLDGNPFPDYDIKRVFFTMFKTYPTKELIKNVTEIEYMDEELIITDLAAYLYIPGSAARSVLSTNYLERKLKVSMTARNFNTMTRMIQMASENDQ
jgi:uncharacterized protein (DUF1697 family)